MDRSYPCLRTTKRPWKGHGYVTWPILNFGGPIYISGMAEARAVTQDDYIKSCQKGWLITLQRGVVGLLWPIFACTTVDLEKFRHMHAVKWDQQCRRRWIFVVCSYDDTLRLKNSISSICCEFVSSSSSSSFIKQTCSYDMSSINRPGGVEPHRAYTCDNYRQLSVCVAMFLQYHLTLVELWAKSSLDPSH